MHCLDGNQFASLKRSCMDLFASAGMDLPRSRAPRRRTITARSSRAPLFAPKVIEEAISRSAPPDDTVIKLAHDYARRVRGLPRRQGEDISPRLHRRGAHQDPWLLAHRSRQPSTLSGRARSGDGLGHTALGHFEAAGNVKKVAAPFELKGPDTKDLDHIMPGRGKTPVQQAGEYGNDAPGAKWVLVSNCVEIRLYGYGRGRRSYEVFDVSQLDEPNELRRLLEILSARNLLGETTNGFCARRTLLTRTSPIGSTRIMTDCAES